MRTLEKLLQAPHVAPAYVEPLLPKVIEYWNYHLPEYDKHWCSSINKIYIEWRLSNSEDRRTFLANFLDDINDKILSRLSYVNMPEEFTEWAYSLAYTLVNFYYIYETYYGSKRIRVLVYADNN